MTPHFLLTLASATTSVTARPTQAARVSVSKTPSEPNATEATRSGDALPALWGCAEKPAKPMPSKKKTAIPKLPATDWGWLKKPVTRKYEPHGANTDCDLGHSHPYKNWQSVTIPISMTAPDRAGI